MAIPALTDTGYVELDTSTSIQPDLRAYDDHVSAIVQDQHWLLAKRARWFYGADGWEDWDGSTDYLERTVGSYLTYLQWEFFTGPGKTQTIDPRWIVRASVPANTGRVRFEVFSTAGASQGSTVIDVTALGTYQAIWSAANTRLEPLTWYRVNLDLNANTAANVRFYRAGYVEEDISATADLP